MLLFQGRDPCSMMCIYSRKVTLLYGVLCFTVFSHSYSWCIKYQCCCFWEVNLEVCKWFFFARAAAGDLMVWCVFSFSLFHSSEKKEQRREGGCNDRQAAMIGRQPCSMMWFFFCISLSLFSSEKTQTPCGMMQFFCISLSLFSSDKKQVRK